MFNSYKDVLSSMVEEYMLEQVKYVVVLAGKEVTEDQTKTLSFLLKDSGVINIVVDELYGTLKQNSLFLDNEQKLLEQVNLAKANVLVVDSALNILKGEKIVKGLSDVSLQILKYLENSN